ncbi:hypothetical protein QF027_000373 [Streptomyces canus]|nr:hypothetical protein [Streptomyces canus]
MDQGTDRAYQGAGATVRTPYYGHRTLQYNRDHARLRAPGERAFARLKSAASAEWSQQSTPSSPANRQDERSSLRQAVLVEWLAGTNQGESNVTEATQDTAAAGAARNTPARISIWAASLGVGLIVGIFMTPMLWLLYGGWYTFLVFVFGVVAVPAGHLGRRRGKHLGGRDRGVALLGIVTGWVLIFCSLLLVLAYAGLLAGLAYLADFTS